MIEKLRSVGVNVKAYDPVSMPESRRRIRDAITYCNDMYEVTQNADALFLITEWTEFRFPDWKKVSGKLKNKILFDGRNLYDKKELQTEGFTYYGVGL
jgi:UDPglucose 6-dehydrogenase